MIVVLTSIVIACHVFVKTSLHATTIIGVLALYCVVTSPAGETHMIEAMGELTHNTFDLANECIAGLMN